MRIAAALFLAGLLTCCSGPGGNPAPAPTADTNAAPHVSPATPAGDTAAATKLDDSVSLHSLQGSGLKFNGVYDSNTNGDIHYVMRFFERGNVALVAGRQQAGDKVDLRDLLTMDAVSGKNNLHNVPVERRGDSLFFSTMANRGAITYAGKLNADSLRFIKYSKATGKRAVVSYGFVPDGTKWP